MFSQQAPVQSVRMSVLISVGLVLISGQVQASNDDSGSNSPSLIERACGYVDKDDVVVDLAKEIKVVDLAARFSRRLQFKLYDNCMANEKGDAIYPRTSQAYSEYCKLPPSVRLCFVCNWASGDYQDQENYRDIYEGCRKYVGPVSVGRSKRPGRDRQRFQEEILTRMFLLQEGLYSKDPNSANLAEESSPIDLLSSP